MKKRQIPHTYAIIFYIILFCAALTWIIPGGQYKESINAAGEKTVVYEAVEHVPQTWQVFSAFYKGFVDKADIIVFILIIGGAFWIVNDSKAFDIGTVSFLGRARKMENNRFLRKIGVENFLLTSIMLLFSIFGAVFGMSEETIAFCLVLVPMAISMGYDSITGVCMVFVAAGLGFAGAILNPFTIGIAQGLAGIPLFSGIEYRIFCWIVINMIGFSWILRYAAKVKKNPKASLVYEEDLYWRDLHNNNSLDVSYHTPRAAWISFGILTVIQIIFAAYYPATTLQIGNSVIKGLPLLPILTAAFILTSLFALRKTVHLYILNLLFFTIFYLITGVMGWIWLVYHGDSHPVLRPRTGSRHRQQPDSQRTGQTVSGRMQGHYERSFGSRPCRRYYRDTERRACHRHHSLQLGERDGRTRTSGDRRHDVRDPDLDQPDHSFRKCQSSPDHADHGSFLRLDRIVKASDRDGLPVRRRIHQYDHPDIGSVDRRSGCQPYPLR